jgi:hypothetical protein
MQSLFKALLRYLAAVAASEAGELLSVRRKVHLLEAERYARHAAEAKPAAKTVATASGHRTAPCAPRTLKARNAH